jgi:hypothetical protein
MADNGAMSSVLVPMHLGTLHAYETALLALLAFGPFVVLGFVVVVLRRRDAAENPGAEESAPEDAAVDERGLGSGR